MLNQSNEKVSAIIQARMGSTRLPEKIMKPLAGKPALWHVINRLGYSKNIDEIIIATTINNEDSVIEEFCRDYKVTCFRGSEQDVLDRYYQAATKFSVDHIVRITSDCPLIDPCVVDEVVAGYFEGNYDLYGLGNEFPDGLDCVIFSYPVLKNTWKNASLPSEREHVGPYMEKHPEKYRTGRLNKFKGLSHHRWTLDEQADLRFLEEIFNRLYREEEIFLTQEILDLLEKEPQLMALNSHIIRNEGYLKSLTDDEKYLDLKKP